MIMAMEVIEKSVVLPGREELKLRLELNGEEIAKAELSAVGNLKMLRAIDAYRDKIKGLLIELPLPKGHQVWEIMLRELILKAQGKWDFPFKDEELCHCRGISLAKVDQSILTGAHTPEQVSEQTSASTACGTCRPDVESIILYRIGRGE